MELLQVFIQTHSDEPVTQLYNILPESPNPTKVILPTYRCQIVTVEI